MQGKIALKYDVAAMIGMGTQAKIHHCMDRATGEELVVKIIYYGDIDRDSKEYYGMSREGYLMQGFHHPYILPVREVVIDSRLQTINIIMPLMKYSLKKLIQSHRRRREPIPEADIWKYTYQLLSALHYLHDPSTEAWYKIPELLSRSTSRRPSCIDDKSSNAEDDQGAMDSARIHFPIPHRDIKPDNILLDYDNNIKLADFTMAAQFDEEELRQLKNITLDYVTNTEESGFAGAPGYRAPEAYYSVAGVENDIWALGCVVYEMATTERLFPNTDVQKAYFSGENRFGICLPGRSSELVKLVEAMLTINPAARPRASQLLRNPCFKDILSDDLKRELYVPSDIARKLLFRVETCDELKQLLCKLSWSGSIDECSLEYLFNILRSLPLTESVVRTVGDDSNDVKPRINSSSHSSARNSIRIMEPEASNDRSMDRHANKVQSSRLVDEPISPSRGYILYSNISPERYNRRCALPTDSAVDKRRAFSATPSSPRSEEPARAQRLATTDVARISTPIDGDEDALAAQMEASLSKFDEFCTIKELREMQNLTDLRNMPDERAAQRSHSAFSIIKENVRHFSYPSPARLQEDYNEKYESAKWNPKGFASLKYADSVTRCIEKLRQINRTCQHVRSNSPVNSHGRTSSAQSVHHSISIPRGVLTQRRLS
ncbi:Serine/threonine protein kinase [Giardia duodenalis]|uniref:non-specific serine/threonine protein kinase n=1 Tax=Giardia intestinalis TaxID=5741 RepID=V6TGS9_GIAIN|nr:Serine/threonine protein kinase [Giardia intestinalis]